MSKILILMHSGDAISNFINDYHIFFILVNAYIKMIKYIVSMD